MLYMFTTEFFWLWIKIEKCEILYWDLHNAYTETVEYKKTMNDIMNKNTSIVLTISSLYEL